MSLFVVILHLFVVVCDSEVILRLFFWLCCNAYLSGRFVSLVMLCLFLLVLHLFVVVLSPSGYVASLCGYYVTLCSFVSLSGYVTCLCGYVTL